MASLEKRINVLSRMLSRQLSQKELAKIPDEKRWIWQGWEKITRNSHRMFLPRNDELDNAIYEWLRRGDHVIISSRDTRANYNLIFCMMKTEKSVKEVRTIWQYHGGHQCYWLTRAEASKVYHDSDKNVDLKPFTRDGSSTYGEDRPSAGASVMVSPYGSFTRDSLSTKKTDEVIYGDEFEAKEGSARQSIEDELGDDAPSDVPRYVIPRDRAYIRSSIEKRVAARKVELNSKIQKLTAR